MVSGPVFLKGKRGGVLTPNGMLMLLRGRPNGMVMAPQIGRGKRGTAIGDHDAAAVFVASRGKKAAANDDALFNDALAFFNAGRGKRMYLASQFEDVEENEDDEDDDVKAVPMRYGYPAGMLRPYGRMKMSSSSSPAADSNVVFVAGRGKRDGLEDGSFWAARG